MSLMGPCQGWYAFKPRLDSFVVVCFCCLMPFALFCRHFTESTVSKNIPAEALPAHENDENEYFVTARSVFFHWKPLQKKGPSTLWITTLPWLQPEKGQPQLFLKFSSTCQRWFPSGFYLCTPTATGKNACISIFEDCVPGPFSRVNFQGWLLWGPSRIHLRDPCGSWLSPCSSGFWCDKSCPGCDCIVAREGHIFWPKAGHSRRNLKNIKALHIIYY